MSARPCSPLRRRIRADASGYTLTEFIIVVAMLVVVLGGTLSVLDTAADIAPKEQERAHAVREAQVGLHRMTRELRQATQVVSPAVSPDKSAIMRIWVPVAGVSTEVTYSCNVGSQDLPDGKHWRCVRSWTQGGQAQSVTVIERLTDPNIFSRTSEAFVKVRVEVPASGERKRGLDHTIVLDDGFFMRNLSVGS